MTDETKPTMPSEELREYNRMLAEGYQTSEGMPIELKRLVRAEPAWACNVIRASREIAQEMTGVRMELKECEGKLEELTKYANRVENISEGYRQHGLVMAEKYNEMTAYAIRWEYKAEVYRSQAIRFGDERDVASALLEGAGILAGESRTLAERIESVLRLIGDGDREIDRLRKERDELRLEIGKLRDKSNDGHCKDCCCAQAWEALGVTEYTGESIPEYIKKTVAERDEAQKNYAFMVDRAANEKLDGYRALGARAAAAENLADDLRRRLRGVAQVLIAEVGAEGPCSAVDAADKAVDHIQKLRQKVSQHEADLAVWLHVWTTGDRPPSDVLRRAEHITAQMKFMSEAMMRESPCGD